MQVDGRLSRNLRILFWIFCASALVGALIGISRTQQTGVLGNALSGALTGTVIGLGGTLCELYIFSNVKLRIIRRLPVIAIMVIRALVYSVLIVVGLTIPELVTGDILPWQEPDFWELFAISASVALGFSVGVEVMRQLGAEATLALFTGRYNRPRLEDRVILFADLVGSTALAERVGELQFHAFLQEVALDLAGPIEHNSGRVHRYVGDAVIVTWPMGKGIKDAACLSCATAMHQVLDDRAAIYERRFGTSAKLRVAVHCGQVAAGDIGDWKKEIALLGDAMNTAARIESAARDLGVTTVLSDDVVRRFPQEQQDSLRRLPDYKAPGKQTLLTLWTPDAPAA